MNNNLNRGGIVRVCIAFTLFTVISVIFYGLSYASEELQPGSRYKIVKPVYLIAAYENLNNRQVSRETAFAYLRPRQSPKRAWLAFQSEVPIGAIMTIIGPAPKPEVWHFPFFFKRYSVYLVRLDPDLSRGLDVMLELSLGMEGSLDGLNPELFSRQ
jgi:hypothetical protein